VGTQAHGLTGDKGPTILWYIHKVLGPVHITLCPVMQCC